MLNPNASDLVLNNDGLKRMLKITSFENLGNLTILIGSPTTSVPLTTLFGFTVEFSCNCPGVIIICSLFL